MDEERLKVVRRDAYNAGWCQGCADKEADVYEITAGHWVTRFCRACLGRIVKVANLPAPEERAWTDGDFLDQALTDATDSILSPYAAAKIRSRATELRAKAKRTQPQRMPQDPEEKYCPHGWDTRLECSKCLQDRTSAASSEEGKT